MAPMAGVTDQPFRERLRTNGCRALWTEMVSAAALVRKHKNSLKMCAPGDLSDDVALQLFGSRPAELGDAAKIVSDMGWQRIDLNMGCPVKKVVKSGSGVALMRDETNAAGCVKAVRSGFGGVFTVKLRLGWSEQERNFLNVAKMADSEGVDGIILHGRTRAQGYSGRADWNAVGELARAVRVPVAGNGDVTTALGAAEALDRYGIAAVMIGRGALETPWIFRDAELIIARGEPFGRPPFETVVADLLAQLDRVAELKGERTAICEMKKFAAWADKGTVGAPERRNLIMRAGTRRELEGAISRIGQPAGE